MASMIKLTDSFDDKYLFDTLHAWDKKLRESNKSDEDTNTVCI